MDDHDEMPPCELLALLSLLTFNLTLSTQIKLMSVCIVYIDYNFEYQLRIFEPVGIMQGEVLTQSICYLHMVYTKEEFLHRHLPWILT